MKKILLSIGVVLTSLVSNAQVDTLTEFFTGTPTVYSTGGGGYVGGNNEYLDKAKMQLFDAAHGVTGAGSITNLLLWAPIKAGTGTFRAVIWANNAGTPGAELGSVTINIASVDTTAAGLNVADGAVGYNVSATFASAIAVPANGQFWAGVVLPTTAGDTIALVTNTAGDFADGLTHTGEIWSDDVFYTFGDSTNWNLLVALAIFPVVNFALDIEENSISTSVYPNPAQNELNVSGVAVGSTINVYNNLGQVVLTTEATNELMTLNVANFVSGIYTVKTINGTNVGVAKFVKK